MIYSTVMITLNIVTTFQKHQTCLTDIVIAGILLNYAMIFTERSVCNGVIHVTIANSLYLEMTLIPVK